MDRSKIIDINVAEVFRMLWADRRKVCIYSFVAGVIGVILAFGTPKVYKSTVLLAPEESGAGFSGSLSSLASMVGMNMRIGQTGDALYPEIYPDLMGSTDFIVGLFPVKVRNDKTDEEYTYYDYINAHQRVALHAYPFVWLDALKEKLFSDDDGTGPGHKVDPFRLTKKEFGVMKAISSNIQCMVDKKTNVITITVEDQVPLIAATMADSVQVHLQHAITDYRTKKARIDLEYMQQLYDEAQAQYKRASETYASYADSYQDVNLQKYAQQVENLENEMNLKYVVYQQTSEQLHLAKAKVQERTPAFTIVQRASVPIKHSSRPKIVSLAIWMILGFMLRFSMLLWKNRQQFIKI